MKLLDLTLPDPSSNLACDEALLDGEEEVLRFWESPTPFAVVGYSTHLAAEVNVEACRQRGVPVLRRCTGGGAVVQGLGCLNYALIMPATSESVTETNRFIMQRHQRALGELLGQPVSFDGHTDLALDGRKFSGNSQRRRKRRILFHGTILIDFDLTLIEELLRFPSQQPPYRQGRSHTDFLINLHLPADCVKEALRQCWQATDTLTTVPMDRIEQLVHEQYAIEEWNFRV